MKKLDTKTLGTVAGGTLCAGISVSVCPGLPRPRPAAVLSPRSADRASGSLTSTNDAEPTGETP